MSVDGGLLIAGLAPMQFWEATYLPYEFYRMNAAQLIKCAVQMSAWKDFKLTPRRADGTHLR